MCPYLDPPLATESYTLLYGTYSKLHARFGIRAKGSYSCLYWATESYTLSRGNYKVLYGATHFVWVATGATHLCMGATQFCVGAIHVCTGATHFLWVLYAKSSRRWYGCYRKLYTLMWALQGDTHFCMTATHFYKG